MSGTVVVAYDPAAFGDRDAYLRAVDDAITTIQAVPPAEGVQAVLAPGEPESRSREERLRDGIPLPAETWRELRELAARQGVPLMAL